MTHKIILLLLMIITWIYPYLISKILKKLHLQKNELVIKKVKKIILQIFIYISIIISILFFYITYWVFVNYSFFYLWMFFIQFLLHLILLYLFIKRNNKHILITILLNLFIIPFIALFWNECDDIWSSCTCEWIKIYWLLKSTCLWKANIYYYND